MIIGVMSDSHGNIKLMQKAADLMLKKFKADAIVHLGDDYADAKRLDSKGKTVFAVPGMYEAAWDDQKIPHRLIRDFGGVSFMISHTPTRDKHDKHGDINPERALSKYKAQVLLHGHTHKFGAALARDGLIMINPGHLKGDSDRGAVPSFAVINVSGSDLKVSFISPEGEILDSQEFELEKAS